MFLLLVLSFGFCQAGRAPVVRLSGRCPSHLPRHGLEIDNSFHQPGEGFALVWICHLINGHRTRPCYLHSHFDRANSSALSLPLPVSTCTDPFLVGTRASTSTTARHGADPPQPRGVGRRHQQAEHRLAAKRGRPVPRERPLCRSSSGQQPGERVLQVRAC